MPGLAKYVHDLTVNVVERSDHVVVAVGQVRLLCAVSMCERV